jgi:hypothetical protein
MALVLTSRARTARLVFSGDLAVTLKAGDPRKSAWLPVDEAAEVQADATVAEVRALSWLQYQEAEALEPAQQILAVIRAGLVSIDNQPPDAFLADPAASLVVPLYRAIADITWGN